MSGKILKFWPTQTSTPAALPPLPTAQEAGWATVSRDALEKIKIAPMSWNCTPDSQVIHPIFLSPK